MENITSIKALRSIALFLILLNQSAIAASESHTQAAITLLEVTNSHTLTDSMIDEIKQLLNTVTQHESLTNEQELLFKDFKAEMHGLIESRLSWSQLKAEYAEVYTNTYSEGELNQLIAFYQTPLGQKLLNNADIVNDAIADIPQKYIDSLIPEMQTAAQRVTIKINELNQQSTEKDNSTTN